MIEMEGRRRVFFCEHAERELDSFFSDASPVNGALGEWWWRGWLGARAAPQAPISIHPSIIFFCFFISLTRERWRERGGCVGACVCWSLSTPRNARAVDKRVVWGAGGTHHFSIIFSSISLSHHQHGRWGRETGAGVLAACVLATLIHIHSPTCGRRSCPRRRPRT